MKKKINEVENVSIYGYLFADSELICSSGW